MTAQQTLLITFIVTGLVVFLQHAFFRLIDAPKSRNVVQGLACMVCAAVGILVGAYAYNLFKQEFALDLLSAYVQVLGQAATALGIVSARVWKRLKNTT